MIQNGYGDCEHLMSILSDTFRALLHQFRSQTSIGQSSLRVFVFVILDALQSDVQQIEGRVDESWFLLQHAVVDISEAVAALACPPSEGACAARNPSYPSSSTLLDRAVPR